MCNLEMCFGSNDYRWCKVNGTNCDPQSTTSRNLTVSDNVAVAEVGGQIYKCHCSNNPSNCRKYKIAGSSRRERTSPEMLLLEPGL